MKHLSKLLCVVIAPLIACDNIGVSYTVGPEIPSADSLSYYVEKAKSNDNKDLFIAGVLLQSTMSKSDSVEAMKMLEQSACNGYSPAERALAIEFMDSTSSYFDMNKGVELLSKAAEHGHLRAIFELSELHYAGKVVQQNYEKALELSNEALGQLFVLARNNDRRAQFFLGRHFRSGLNVPKDIDEAKKWLKASAEAGYPEGMIGYGHCFFLDSDYKEALKWGQKARKKNIQGAACLIGLLYRDGLGVEQDLAKAFTLFLEDAKRGEIEAMSRVAYSYGNGEGVSRDYAESFKWYKKLADRGSSMALNNIGVMYAEGRGVIQNDNEAFKWYMKAAKKGSRIAEYNVGWYYLYGKGVEQDFTEAYNWFQKAAEHGYAGAYRWLAYCYSNGIGVAKDAEKAAYWEDKGNVW